MATMTHKAPQHFEKYENIFIGQKKNQLYLKFVLMQLNYENIITSIKDDLINLKSKYSKEKKEFDAREHRFVKMNQQLNHENAELRRQLQTMREICGFD